jgi:hypothetical protein
MFFYRRVAPDGAMLSADELQAFLGPERVGTTLAATIIRGGAVHELLVAVAPREQQAAQD